MLVLLCSLLAACSTRTQEAAPAAPEAKQQPATATESAVRNQQKGDARHEGIAATPSERKLLSADYARREMTAPSVAMPAPISVPVIDETRENYAQLNDHPIKAVIEEPVSTFSIDVDTASYANVRRMLRSGQLPPHDAVRVEELINYFPYEYPRRLSTHPFTVNTEIAPAPWGTNKQLIRIGIRAQELQQASLPPANLVFLVDVSGSMNSPDKLPLLKSSLKLLAERIRHQDRVSLVVYASGTGVVLEPTSNREQVLRAIDQLRPGGSTAGEAGIRLAYRMARQAFIQGGINRILLATDGDFNVGISDIGQLKQLVEREREAGISLTTLGFGTGNYNDALMEQLADIGNGNHHYIDSLNEGQKVLVEEMSSTLATVAKDVKIQVEFNPQQVSEYRLIGYNNRMLRREDFNNDKVDAGDAGAGQTVTAIYEVTFTGAAGYLEPLRYGNKKLGRSTTIGEELAFLRLRYKEPDGTRSQLLEIPLRKADARPSFSAASNEFRFATAVASFGELLRGGQFQQGMDFARVGQIATAARGADPFGYRAEFVQLARLAGQLLPGQATATYPID
ncbi:VWA domain-containing protein [Chitinilyticum litopenaei]|uniref:VWA domain-containing protein n=2 Tax=Chitinilyticum piscinae TaxID=2866724 RepID=A0A8J7KGJ8_9NEIS|nr:VWA domain-containing protein [Chitinilyticum piscinae]